MRQAAQNKLSIIFWSICLLDIVAAMAGYPYLHMLTKSLLVPVLLLLTNTAVIKNGLRIVQVGLLFSWFGDVLLLFDGRHALFFIFGLVAFLTTHIFYIIFFLKKKGAGKPFLLQQPWWLLLVPAYGVSLVWLLFPHLGDLTLPVIVYATVICAMLLAALSAYRKVNSKARLYYWLGAVAFVASDSLLAINKFYQPFAYAGAAIMLTYCAAQFLIVKGLLAEE